MSAAIQQCHLPYSSNTTAVSAATHLSALAGKFVVNLLGQSRMWVGGWGVLIVAALHHAPLLLHAAAVAAS